MIAVKEAIKRELENNFEYYVNLNLLKEEAFNFLKSELGLIYWKDKLYYTRNKEIFEAQSQLWKKVEEIAEKYNLDSFNLWKNEIIEQAFLIDYAFEEILKEKGFEHESRYVFIGYDDREGGFIIVINPEIVNHLLDANLEIVTKRLLKQLSKKDLRKLNKALSKSEETFVKTLESLIEEKEDQIIWSYIEESKKLWNFVEVVKELKEYLASCLLDMSIDLENWVK